MKPEERIGQRFNRLVITGMGPRVPDCKPREEGGRVRMTKTYECICDCGNKTTVRCGLIKLTKSCGCSRAENLARLRSQRGLKPSEISLGERFGRLTVVERKGELAPGEMQKKNEIKWICSCDCGVKVEVYEYNLLRKHTKSCGCLRDKYQMKTGGPTNPMLKEEGINGGS